MLLKKIVRVSTLCSEGRNLDIFCLYFGRNEDFINSFWNCLTFKKRHLLPKYHCKGSILERKCNDWFRIRKSSKIVQEQLFNFPYGFKLNFNCFHLEFQLFFQLVNCNIDFASLWKIVLLQGENANFSEVSRPYPLNYQYFKPRAIRMTRHIQECTYKLCT